MSRSSERGSILIMVAVGLVVLTAFSSFVIDYGVLWVGRSQAQNAADAGALAGAVARAFDEAGVATPAVNGPTVQSINRVVDMHQVVGTSGASLIRTWSWTCPPAPISGAGSNCVRVDVFRDGSNGSTRLPIFFGSLIGLADQRTRATATAHSATANGTTCLKPWLIPDKWIEVQAPANEFNVAIPAQPGKNGKPGTPAIPGDQYQNPGYTTANIGLTVTLKEGNPNSNQPVAPGDFFRIEDANTYKESISGCIITKGIGQTVTTRPGNGVGPTNQGVDDLLAANNGQPVTVIVAMYDPAQWAAQDKQTGIYDLTIVNMMGFRITSAGPGNQINGTLVSGPGEILPGVTATGGNLIKAIQLIQ